MNSIVNQELTQSEFNGAVDFLTRINNIFYLIDESRIQDEYKVWIKSLETLYYELSTEMTSKELEEGRTIIKRAKEELKKYISQEFRTGRASFSISVEETLNDLEIKIRKIMKRAGLLYKKSDSEEDEDYEY